MRSLKLPSSTWAGALVPAEELRDTVMYIFLEEEPGPCPQGCTTVSGLLLFFLHSLPSLMSNFESALWESGKVKEVERSLFPTNKKEGPGHRKDLCPGGPHRVLLHFNMICNQVRSIIRTLHPPQYKHRHTVSILTRPS